jgi:hypothetical protein
METTVSDKPLNVYQRINEVRKQCAFVKKDKKVEGGGYMAVTHDAVTAELRDHLIAQGIVIVPRLKEAHVVDTGTTTARGIPIIRYEAKFEIDFVNMDEPSDKVTVPNEAHANDQGDKAPGKATSYATKYAMLKLFSIETGENEEERHIETKIREDKAKITPRAGALERVAPERREYVERVAGTIIDCFAANMPGEALKAYTELSDVDEKVACWDFLDSKQRRELKRLGQEQQQSQTTAPRAH